MRALLDTNILIHREAAVIVREDIGLVFNDTKILNELFTDRVDILITEDRAIIRKAEKLGIADKVFAIDAFLEKVVAENPSLTEYKVLSVRKVLFGELNLADHFFDDLRQDYPDFDRWFNRKSDEPAYVCFEGDQLVAFLYLKVEDRREAYPDVVPAFRPKRRLKIRHIPGQAEWLQTRRAIPEDRF